VRYFALEENISRQTEQPKRGGAAAARWPRILPIARLKMYSWQTGTCKAHMYTTYVCGWPQISQTLCTHTNMDSTSSLTLLPTLAEQDGGPTEGAGVDPSSSKAQALCLPSRWPSVPVSPVSVTWAYNPWGSSSTSVTGTDYWVHTHPELARTFWVPTADPPVRLPL